MPPISPAASGRVRHSRCMESLGGIQDPASRPRYHTRPKRRSACASCLIRTRTRFFVSFGSSSKNEIPMSRSFRNRFFEPYLGPHTGPYADAARDAMRTAFGRNPAFVREGGSIGAVVTMQKYLKAPIVFLGLSLPEHGYHAPNENFDWEQASGRNEDVRKILRDDCLGFRKPSSFTSRADAQSVSEIAFPSTVLSGVRRNPQRVQVSIPYPGCNRSARLRQLL